MRQATGGHLERALLLGIARVKHQLAASIVVGIVAIPLFGSVPLIARSTAAASSLTTSSDYYALTPTRLLDSRNGTGLSGAFGSHEPRSFAVAGVGGACWGTGTLGLGGGP